MTRAHNFFTNTKIHSFSSIRTILKFTMNVESLQSAMHHDAGSLSGNSITATAATLDYAGYVPVNNISTEAYALLAAAEALAARAGAVDLGNNWTTPERAECTIIYVIISVCLRRRGFTGRSGNRYHVGFYIEWPILNVLLDNQKLHLSQDGLLLPTVQHADFSTLKVFCGGPALHIS
jgi:hypothetical protein